MGCKGRRNFMCCINSSAVWCSLVAVECKMMFYFRLENRIYCLLPGIRYRTNWTSLPVWRRASRQRPVFLSNRRRFEWFLSFHFTFQHSRRNNEAINWTNQMNKIQAANKQNGCFIIILAVVWVGLGLEHMRAFKIIFVSSFSRHFFFHSISLWLDFPVSKIETSDWAGRKLDWIDTLTPEMVFCACVCACLQCNRLFNTHHTEHLNSDREILLLFGAKHIGDEIGGRTYLLLNPFSYKKIENIDNFLLRTTSIVHARQK